MLKSCPQPGSWVGSCPWLMQLLLLLLLLGDSSGQTAYLVGSMQQTYEASNSSFNSLGGVIRAQPAYSTIVLTEDYWMSPGEFQAADQVRLSQPLLITSSPGEQHQLSFAFLNNVVLMNSHTVTLRNIAIDSARKVPGQSVPFFFGEGKLEIEDTFRLRLACGANINGSASALRTAPRPTAFPGTQAVSVQDTQYRGKTYPDSVRADDVVVFVSPGDVEDAAYSAGYSVVLVNTTRLCETYVPAGCNEQCIVATVDAMLAARAGPTSRSQSQQLVATVVPAVVVPVVVLAAAAVAAAFWHRRRQAARKSALKQQQDEQVKLNMRLEEGSGGAFGPGWPDSKGSGGRSPQPLPYGRGVPAGLLGRSLDTGVVGSIEEVAVGANASNSNHRGWQLMACHTAPEFPEATAKDAITLGVLLGAGSFGRVYCGRWRGLDVAVKVLHHDVNTAASVANEVDLVMSFRHPNITTAYHFLTWNYSHDTSDVIHTSGSQAGRTSAAGDAAAAATASAAAPGASSAGAAASSTAEPSTPIKGRQLPARLSTDLTSSGQHTSAGSNWKCGGLSAIQSQSIGSSALAASSSGNAISRGRAPGNVQQCVSGQLDASAEAGLPAVVGAAAPQGASSSNGGSGPCTSSSTAPKLQHVPLFSPGVLLQNLDSPHTARSPDSMQAPGEPAGQQNGSGPAPVLGAAALSDSAAVMPQANPIMPPAESVGGSPPEQGGHAVDPSRPEGNAQPGWASAKSQVLWGPSVLSPGQLSGWGAAVGPGQQAFGRLRDEPQQQQQGLQQVHPLQQQEFVPMVPCMDVRQHTTQEGQASGQPPPRQQQRFVPLIQPQHEQHQEQERPPMSASLLSNPSNLHTSGQLRQLQRTGRFDTGSGSSSYAGGGGRARSGEAQTWLILEHCDGGTLLDVMQEGELFDPSTGDVNLAHVLTLLADIAAGMNYLHLRNCVHGDLKPANVLLKKQQGAPFGHVAKVSDFGLSKSLMAGQSHRSTRTLGTFNRAPPELLRLGRLSPSCDVYAFGVLIWELFTGRIAFAGLHYGEVFERVALMQERPPIPPDMPRELSSLMVSCWDPEPLARPTFRMVQQSILDILLSLPNTGDRFFADL